MGERACVVVSPRSRPPVSWSPLGANVDISLLTLDLNDNTLDIDLNEGIHGAL
ncbi:hypothetical protein [Crossiella sp. NPDC003009]